MIKFFILFLSAFSLAFSAQGVFSQVQTLPCPTKNPDAYLATYITKENTLFMTWTDDSNNQSWYAIYNPKTNSFFVDPKPLDLKGFIETTYIEKNNTIFLAILDSSNNLFYQYYDCATNLFIADPVKLFSNIAVPAGCYISRDNLVFLTFSSPTGSERYYAIFDCNSNQLTTQETLPGLVSEDLVFPTYNPHNNTVFMTASSDSQSKPCYAIFDCESLSISTPLTPIDPEFSQESDDPLSTIINNQQVFICWEDTQPNSAIWYAVYDYTQKGFLKQATQLMPGSALMSPTFFPTPQFYPMNNTVLITWPGANTNYYAIYDCIKGGVIESPTPIPYNQQAARAVEPILIYKNSTVFLTWIVPNSDKFYFQNYFDKNFGLRKSFLENSKTSYQKGSI
jgi:hypothetical protein